MERIVFGSAEFTSQLMVGFSFRVTRAQGMREWLPTVEYDWWSKLRSTAQTRTWGTNRALRRSRAICPFKVCFASGFFLSEFINGAVDSIIPVAASAGVMLSFIPDSFDSIESFPERRTDKLRLARLVRRNEATYRLR